MNLPMHVTGSIRHDTTFLDSGERLRALQFIMVMYMWLDGMKMVVVIGKMGKKLI